MANGRVRTAIVATHPIQNQAPWFRALAREPELDVRVYFGMVPDADQQGIGFGVPFEWDVPLLDGYDYEVLRNVARRPGIAAFGGCDAPGIAGALRAWHPQVAVLTGWHSKMLIQAWWACVRQGVRRVVRGESNALHARPAWKRAAHRLWLSGFDRFLAIGAANRDFYLQAGVPAALIHDCPYGVDNARFEAAAAAQRARRGEWRRRWSIPDGATCFLFCGKLVAKKRPLDLLRALGRAVRAGAPAHVLVVGDGELMKEARALVAAAALPASFAGFLNQTEIVAAYVASDCLVLPSDAGETWGLVVNEAMACGRPAIVSDRVGCAADLVAPGVTGAVYPVGDVDALARALGALAGDGSALATMGERARERVRARCSVERAVAGALEAIRAATARR